MHGQSSILNKDYLKSDHKSNNHKEHPVGDKALENIIVICANLSAIELVEDLHPYESVEDHSEDNAFSCGLSTNKECVIVLIRNIPHIVHEEIHNS